MQTPSTDPVINVIHQQIRSPIRLLWEAGHPTAAIKLVYSGIDTMAYLAMPDGKDEVTRSDFIAWCERYMRFEGPLQLTGKDFYGARCAMLHKNGTASRLSAAGECRQVVHTTRMLPPVRFDPSIDPGIVAVCGLALAEAFFAGSDACLTDLFASKARGAVAERRLGELAHLIPSGA